MGLVNFLGPIMRAQVLSEKIVLHMGIDVTQKNNETQIQIRLYINLKKNGHMAEL